MWPPAWLKIPARVAVPDPRPPAPPVIDGIDIPIPPREEFVHSLDRPRPAPIPAVLANRTIGVVQAAPPRDVADLAGKPLDYWRYLVADWGNLFWLAWEQYLDRHRTGIEGPDDLDLLERRAFDSVLSLPETVDPRPPQ